MDAEEQNCPQALWESRSTVIKNYFDDVLMKTTGNFVAASGNVERRE